MQKPMKPSFTVRTHLRAGDYDCKPWDTNCWAMGRDGNPLLDKNENPVFRNCNGGYPMAGEACWLALYAAGYKYPDDGACMKC